MNTFAFMLDGPRAFQADDLITPAYLVLAAVTAIIACAVMVRDRRYRSYAVAIACIPTAAVFARCFFATLQFDLTDYPNSQLWSGLIATFGPLTLAALFHFCFPRRPNQSLDTNVLSRQ